MTPPHRGDDFSGMNTAGVLLMVVGLLALLPLKIVLTAASIVVIVVGFQLVIGFTGFVMLFIVLGTFIAMPFMFLYFKWDERGGWAETMVRTEMKKGATRDEAIARVRGAFDAPDRKETGIALPAEVEALR